MLTVATLVWKMEMYEFISYSFLFMNYVLLNGEILEALKQHCPLLVASPELNDLNVRESSITAHKFPSRHKKQGSYFI